MNYDFTLSKYKKLCEAILKNGFNIVKVKNFLENDLPESPFCVFRHDIDRNISCALSMAELEAKLGIYSTYYVRMTKNAFNIDKIKKIFEYGHDIGFHHECLAKSKGNIKVAGDIFKKEVNKLRKIVPVHTCSMHGNPLSKWNNISFWNFYTYKEFGLLGDFSLAIDFSNSYYFTDTGRNWDCQRNNLRDHVASLKPEKHLQDTNQLIDFLESNAESRVFINAHPNRWKDDPFTWFLSLISDLIINQAKKILK